MPRTDEVPGPIADRVSGGVRTLLANLPKARFLPKPEGSVTIFRDYVLAADQSATDDFVIAAGGSIEVAPAHDAPVMSAAASSVTLTAGEKYYVIPATALEVAQGV